MWFSANDQLLSFLSEWRESRMDSPSKAARRWGQRRLWTLGLGDTCWVPKILRQSLNV
uniref:Uncharacterized protein n=1 Tax=Anguilla anguilla TaxID=7936 RepID=A0A0E9XYZ3_ANGAN